MLHLVHFNYNHLYMKLFRLRFIQNCFLSQGTGYSQSHVYPGDLWGLDHVIPKDALIDEFGKPTTPINDRIAKNLALSQQLAQLRDWLLPLLMNGQVMVT